MKLLVIALALVSVSNQNPMSFGHFVGGTNQVKTMIGRSFSIKNSSDDKFNRLLGSQVNLIAAYNTGELVFVINKQFRCIKLQNFSPVCEYTVFSEDNKYLLQFLYNIVFEDPKTAEVLYKKVTDGKFIFKSKKHFLTLYPMDSALDIFKYANGL